MHNLRNFEGFDFLNSHLILYLFIFRIVLYTDVARCMIHRLISPECTK